MAYELNPILERSLSSSLLEDDNEDDSVQCCRCGCTEILTRLKDVFDAIGLHNARTQASYAKSYPNPKKRPRITMISQVIIRRNVVNHTHAITMGLNCTKNNIKYIKTRHRTIHYTVYVQHIIHDTQLKTVGSEKTCLMPIATYNYLFCVHCIRSSLQVHLERLSRQRQIKVRLCQEPIVSMSKQEVIQKRLQTFVVFSSTDAPCDNFQEWWDNLGEDEEVDAKFPLANPQITPNQQ